MYAEDLLRKPLPTASAEAAVPPVDIQKPVLTPAPVPPIVTIPVHSINAHQNAIPAANPVLPQNRIPGLTAAGAELPVQSIPGRNPVPAEDPLLRPVPTASAEIAVLPVDIQKQ